MRRSIRLALVAGPIVLIQSIGTLPALAAAGDLDPSFSHDGLVLRRDIVGGIYSMAIQPDGKIVAAGVGSVVGRPLYMVLARFNADGTLDPSFGNEGVVRTRFAGDGYAWSVALLPGGGIVAGGSVGTADGGPTKFLVVRYDANGALDRTFSGDGKVRTRFGAGLSQIYDLAVQPDGKIVAVGYTCCDHIRFALARYLPDGSRDPAFGNNGKVSTPFKDSAIASGVALQADGKIVVSGERGDTCGAVARYLPDGTLDQTFGGDGRAVTRGRPFGGWDIALTSTGSAIVSGTAFGLHGAENQIAVTRFTSDGVFDRSFGVDGFAEAKTGGGQGFGAVAVQPDGKIVTTGYRYTAPAFLAARWNTDGTADAGFGQDGVAAAEFPSGRSSSVAVAVTSDGGILTGGYAGYNGNDDWALVKFLGS